MASCLAICHGKTFRKYASPPEGQSKEMVTDGWAASDPAPALLTSKFRHESSAVAQGLGAVMGSLSILPKSRMLKLS
jgi:hypothetical protein